MNAAAIAAALAAVEALMKLIPQWIESARAKGELTAEQEADFQKRQDAVFASPYSQPEQRPDATKPDV